jgi:hypothetical protein
MIMYHYYIMIATLPTTASMTATQAIQVEIEKLENEIKTTHWFPARTRLRKKIWNLQIKLSKLA